MHRYHTSLRIGETHVADTHSTAARTRPRTSHRRQAILAALVAASTLATTTGAVARPASDVGTPTNIGAAIAVRDHQSPATRSAITFTNPLGRSRGPGAGAGQL